MIQVRPSPAREEVREEVQGHRASVFIDVEEEEASTVDAHHNRSASSNTGTIATATGICAASQPAASATPPRVSTDSHHPLSERADVAAGIGGWLPGGPQLPAHPVRSMNFPASGRALQAPLRVLAMRPLVDGPSSAVGLTRRLPLRAPLGPGGARQRQEGLWFEAVRTRHRKRGHQSSSVAGTRGVQSCSHEARR